MTPSLAHTRRLRVRKRGRLAKAAVLATASRLTTADVVNVLTSTWGEFGPPAHEVITTIAETGCDPFIAAAAIRDVGRTGRLPQFIEYLPRFVKLREQAAQLLREA